jgi:hypothetical protein
MEKMKQKSEMASNFIQEGMDAVVYGPFGGKKKYTPKKGGTMSKLQDYGKRELEAAMRMKGTTAKEVGVSLGRSRGAVYKYISGTAAWPSPKFEKQVIDALQPELDIIHNAFSSVMNSTMVSAETRMGIMEREA